MNNDLFLNNINFVKKIIKKFDYGYLEKDDLYQAGLIGLYKACKQYKDNLNNNFLSFASIYIISEIKNELRTNKLIKKNKKIIKVKKYLQDEQYNKKSIEDIADELNVNKELVFITLDHYNDITSLNEIKENEELINNISYNNEDSNKKYYEYYIDKLDYLSREIIILKYYKNYSQSEIAKILKCSQSTISRIEKKALNIIKQKIS